ncbi:hypothetical protein RB195_017889 [Necator americanus]|uniref:Uncharacterized protein n=1 Tax=Necator americanus TaxID=51031 RepID=A0ABR1C773_NECAM
MRVRAISGVVQRNDMSDSMSPFGIFTDDNIVNQRYYRRDSRQQGHRLTNRLALANYIDSSIEVEQFEDITSEPDAPVKQQDLVKSPTALLPPPQLSAVAEDITAFSNDSFENSTDAAATSNLPRYTVLSVADLLNATDYDNVTAMESAEVKEQTVAPVTVAPTTPVPLHTKLFNEVMTYVPPTEPPIYFTLVNARSTTRGPLYRNLKYGEVVRKAKPYKKLNLKAPKGISKKSKRFDLAKALFRLQGNRRLVSRDIGPPGRKVPLPHGWRVTQLRNG